MDIIYGQSGLEGSESSIFDFFNENIVLASVMLSGSAFHKLGSEWLKHLCPYRAVLTPGVTSVNEFCDLNGLLGLCVLSMSLI